MPHANHTQQRFLKTKKKFRGIARFQAVLRKKFMLLFLVFFTLALFFYGVFRSSMLQIRTIQINGIYENEVLSQETARLKGRNFLLFNTKKYETFLTKTFPEVSEITVTKKFPNTVYIGLDRRVPVAVLVSQKYQEEQDATQSGQVATAPALLTVTTTKYFIDKYGVPFAAIDESGVTTQTATTSAIPTQISNLPALYAIEKNPVMLGKSLESDFVSQVLRIHEQSSNTPFRFLQYRQVSSTSFEVKSFDNAVILFSTTRSAASQLVALQILYESSTIDRKKAKKIDIRFNKPVLTY